MLNIENVEVFGWKAAIRGMRSPKNSWDKSDSYEGVDCNACGILEKEGLCDPGKNRHICRQYEGFEIGENDLKLMKTLSKAGTDHAKFLRMINVTIDITAPLYWWKEFDTYKVGTVANSCSTMHKIHAKEFTLDDFSHDHLWDTALMQLKDTIDILNVFRDAYHHPGSNEKHKKDCWWQMIQLLPSSYNQKRTVQLNYAVLKNMYDARKNHKLDEWHTLCDMCKNLPYFNEICVED